MADEILRRIDRSLARIDEHMERGNTLIEEDRTFMRELLLRHERVTNQMIEQLRELTRETRAGRREFVEEMQAQRAALFRILDRFDNGGATAGA